ncbi:MAG TPA: 50S ribosomal protein L6 [Spirochaetota bacterium]|nr:50S ribosomal protein L6 [Spirochaetota bacterium]HQO00848.1 50S ribosomal protein L6 [Spirochaetota bacterium]HQP48059.1 50S ribosomal protein L6 [Spirochaetota bacterium]
MSRIGKKPIPIPKDVTVDINGRVLTVKGKLGSEILTLVGEMELELKDDTLFVINKGAPEDKQNHAYHGLIRSLVANMVTGVSAGFERNLEIVGVGYRVTQQNKDIMLQLGFSHNIEFAAPEGITLEVVDATKLKIKGVNKQQVGQVAANIRKLRPPEPYKGKGIRYSGEQVRRKAGKAGKK